MPLEKHGPNGACLHEVIGADSPLLDIACELFLKIFPEDHRYVPYIRACAQQRHPSHPNTFDHVWLVKQNEEWVGLRVFSYIITRDFGHGAYIGLTNKVRGQGLGKWLVKQTLEQLDLDARQFGKSASIGYLVEVERSVDAKSEADRLADERRLQFHRQCGGIILPVPFMEPVMIEDVSYIDPAALKDESPRPMHLILIPSSAGIKSANLDIVDLVHGLYLDVYRLKEDHEFVRNALSSFVGGHI